jgi:AAHS family 4-hydroxybenzoate transporter-like MFS transporter
MREPTMSMAIANVAEILDQKTLGTFQKGVIALCTAIVFVEGMNAQSAGYVAPALREAWGLTPSELGLFFSSGLIGLMFGGLFVAPLADRIGRRPILLACVMLFGVCSLATAASASITLLDVLRFFAGLGIGGAMPNAIALTAEYSPLRRRSSMIAVMMTGFILGSIVAGLIAAKLIPDWGWQSVFVVGGVLPLLLLPLLFYALPESIRFLVVSEAPREPIARLLNRIDPAADIGPNTRLVVEEHPASRASVLALFRDGRARSTTLLWVIYFMSLLNLYLFTSWLTTHVREAGLSVGIAIIVGTMFQVGGAFGAVFGWMFDRVGPSRTIFTAYLVGAIAIACIGFAEGDLVMLTISVFTAGFGIIGGQTAANALAAMAYPTQIRSTGVGWATGIGRAGSIVGPGLAGVLIEAGLSTQNIFYLAVIPALIAAAAGAALGGLRVARSVEERAPA